ncbi:hypothetical protein AB1K70_03405 [Bremerella sp. JC770]|uniref:hypothetical protein n=1 Tax=Bremerella sp. JC770 TaxID=3232137 RepID=UPI0034598AC6
MSEVSNDHSNLSAAILDLANDSDAIQDADAQDMAEFESELEQGANQLEEQAQQEQYDRNFQAMSYQFMKGVFSHAEDSIRKG